MERVFSYCITEADAGKDIRAFLRAEGYSHHILAHIKPLPNAVRVNGDEAPMYRSLRAGDILHIRVEDPESSETVESAPVPFTIVYEDEDLLVIDKPAGVSIHPAPGHPADTLANGLVYHYAQQGIPFVVRCINRLDRDTTGLLIVAKNLVSASMLETMLQRRDIRRTYLAIVEGVLPESGTIDLPIGRKPGSLVERCVADDGDRAVTHYHSIDLYAGTAIQNPAGERSRSESSAAVLNSRSTLVKCRRSQRSPVGDMYDGSCVFTDATDSNDIPQCTVAELRLETGRTHQIRVHMAAIGHPLLGDSLYNPRWIDLFERGVPKPGVDLPFGLARQALHSWKLEFTHPITKEPMRFTAPVPEDLRYLFSQI